MGTFAFIYNENRKNCNLSASSLFNLHILRLQVSYVDGGMEDQEESGSEALHIPKVISTRRATRGKTRTVIQS